MKKYFVFMIVIIVTCSTGEDNKIDLIKVIMHDKPDEYLDSLINLEGKSDYSNFLCVFTTTYMNKCELSEYYFKNYIYKDSAYMFASMGFIHLCKSELSEAEKKFNLAVKKFDKRVDRIWPLYGLANVYSIRGLDSIAKFNYEKCYQIDSINPYVNEHYFNSIVPSNKISDIKRLESLLSYFRNNFELDIYLFKKGIFYAYQAKNSEGKLKKENREIAIQSFYDCINTYEGYYDAYISLTNLLFMENRLSEIYKIIDKSKKLFKSDPLLLSIESELLFKINKKNEADSVINIALKGHNNDINILIRAIYIKLVLNKLKETKELVEKAKNLSGESFDIELYDAIIKFKENKNSNSILIVLNKYMHGEDQIQFVKRVLTENNIDHKQFFDSESPNDK